MLGTVWSVKVESEQTGGAIAVLEGSFSPSTGAPPHVHHQHEETLYVLDGEFRFRLGEETVTAPAGTFVFVPRDTAHGFENAGPETGKILGITTPAGFEQFFEELGQLPPGTPDPARFREILDRHDQEQVQ